ncbi:MAG: class I SAM-dependent methyltransferase [Candidatus Woesebacteria bacterium]|nr:class I SAM-dependent methyltransferase [Candidatus Woesebacteria bacterium]
MRQIVILFTMENVIETASLETKSSVGGLSVWNESFRGVDIPGSTRVPIREINDFFKGETENLRGLDVGSGGGRSTKALKEFFKGSDIVALDLSHEGLLLTDTPKKVQAKAEELPFKPEAFDFINVCGVMTNIVDENPEKARELRANAMSALYTVLKPGGCIVISDFSADHQLDNYAVNYDRHALITKERGTIAVLKNGETFLGKSDGEIAALEGSDNIERYAHHYTPKELVDLLQEAGFKVDRYSVEVGLTPKGKKPIENIVVLAKKT